MAIDGDLAKLEISKNLLQMNFMRKTLIAKEKSAKPKAEAFTSVVDINFPLKISIARKLNKRHETVSKWPMVHHLSGTNGTPFVGFRGSFGKFNHYLENLEIMQPAPTESDHTNTKKGDHLSRKSNCKYQSKHKRKSHGMRLNYLTPLLLHLVELKDPLKKARKTNSL